MTVQELMLRLKWLPPDSVVKLADWNEDYAEPTELTDITTNAGEVVLSRE